MKGKTFLAQLEATDVSTRNSSFLQNEELKKLQTIAVANSLNIVKVKMQNDLLAKVNYEKSHEALPLIECEAK
jgi:hypothetical protein